MRVPAAEGWRAALALPPARAAGRGAGGPAGQPAGAQAAGLCEEPAGCRPLAVSGGSRCGSTWWNPGDCSNNQDEDSGRNDS